MKFTVELNSVNRRQSDILVTMPKEIVALEPRIREEINARISRGRLNVVVTIRGGEQQQKPRAELDMALARKYLRAIHRLQREFNLAGPVTLDAILHAPGVLKLNETTLDAEAVWPCVAKALRQALNRLVKMREREGRHLRADLVRRLARVHRWLKKVAALAPQAVEKHRQTLIARIKNAGVELAVDDERLLKEVAFFADRCDISEELTRLDSHIKQFRRHLDNTEPVGRTLDFLTQEMVREINTIGSKANDARISREVVNIKSELEKIREQVQNVE